MATEGKGRQRALKLPPLWERLEGQPEGDGQPVRLSKVAIIVLAVSIPILAEYGEIPGLHDTRALLVGVAAGFILLFEGLQHLNKWQENWILYRATCEGLRHEQHLFSEKAGPYANLSERVGALVSAEHSKWVHARSEKTETTVG